AGNPVSISEASIRSDLQFNDAAGIDVLPNQAIFDTIQLMGYDEAFGCKEEVCHVPKRLKVQFQKDHLKPTPSLIHPSEDQSEPQPDPFLRPSSSNPILDSFPEGSGGNHGGQSSSDRSQSGTEDDLALQSVLSMKKRLARKIKMEFVSKQGRKPFKSVPTVHKDLAFDDLDDAMDYMETKDAHDEGTVKDSEETRVSTEDQVSTDKPNEGTAEPNEGTAEPKDGNSDESAALTTFFRDDEIPLPKIDPKDKGKKVLEEKAESDAESEGVNEAEKKIKMLANDEEIARKVQKEWEAEEEKKLAEEEATKTTFTNEYNFIQEKLNAEKLQEEEREKFTIEKRAKFFHDTIAAQRRFLAQQ
ncbi:hypothetical protein Tco_1486432, partial [Tanacetum coccineum]